MKSRWVVAALVAALVVGLWSAPASAAKKWSPLQLSLDGKTWSTALAKPLFGRATMVPGDTLTRTFFVRNRGNAKAHLAVRVGLQDPAGWVASPGLRFSVGHHGQWRRIMVDGKKAAHAVIPRGGVDSIGVRIRFASSAPTTTQSQSFNFTLNLRLTHSTGR